MLITANSIKELSFSKLMEVYIEGNTENAQDLWPDLPEGQRLLRAEQEFYQYLREGFFSVSGAVYCVWEVEGRYVSALRLEPYEDGLLLEALETAPEVRRKGYGEMLMREALSRWKGSKIYSHVGKRNIPSLNIHRKCGFQRIKEYAVYVDGSVNDRCCTLLYEG